MVHYAVLYNRGSSASYLADKNVLLAELVDKRAIVQLNVFSVASSLAEDPLLFKESIIGGGLHAVVQSHSDVFVVIGHPS